MRDEMAAAVRDMAREQMALFCLGPKGEHFDGDDWEHRADLLAGPQAGAYLRGEIDAA